MVNGNEREGKVWDLTLWAVVLLDLHMRTCRRVVKLLTLTCLQCRRSKLTFPEFWVSVDALGSHVNDKGDNSAVTIVNAACGSFVCYTLVQQMSVCWFTLDVLEHRGAKFVTYQRHRDWTQDTRTLTILSGIPALSESMNWAMFPPLCVLIAQPFTHFSLMDDEIKMSSISAHK